MEVRVLTSPGDGVGPAVLLELPHLRPSVQYMFGAPEGISRLALEQRQRPGLGLRAVFGYQAHGLQVLEVAVAAPSYNGASSDHPCPSHSLRRDWRGFSCACEAMEEARSM